MIRNPPKPTCRWIVAGQPKQKKSKEKLLKAVEQRKCTYPERIGQPECKFYLKFGLCKFGPICKFHHPKVRVGINEVQLNSHGYPLRPHVNECFTYLRSGWCKFGDICKYNHPEPSDSPLLLSLTISGQQSYPGGLTSFYASPHCQDPSSYAQTIIPEGLVQLQSWNTFPDLRLKKMISGGVEANGIFYMMIDVSSTISPSH